MSAQKSQAAQGFHDHETNTEPAGYAWLINNFELLVPDRPRLAAISTTHRTVETPHRLILTPRHKPEPSLAGHLEFAIKWEGVDLTVIDVLATQVDAGEIAAAIRKKPHGQYLRRFWFLYEWLTGATLDVPDLESKRAAVLALDPDQQCALAQGEISARHRIRNNLPGTPAFCPLVRLTPEIVALRARRLDERARSVIGRTHPDVIARAAAFLLLSDSKASFAIEEERPSADRAKRWAQAIARAGSESVSVDSLTALQRILIDDLRFVHLGLRTEGGFIGDHDRDSHAPLPEHISAKHQDLKDLMVGIEEFDARVRLQGFDPVAAAASLAFGFVYIHPFEDGNGRLHRWLIHHVLAAMDYTPHGIVFPVSAAMLRKIDEYRRVLRSYSSPLLPFIEWRPTEESNVEVVNDTARFYRYFDATAHAAFLYQCIAETVDRDLPHEVAYLEAYDRFVEGVQTIVDMPARTVDLLHRFLRQNGGALSKRARDGEFARLSADEVAAIERLFAGGAAQTERADLKRPSVVPEDERRFQSQMALWDSPIKQKARSHGFWTVAIHPGSFSPRRVDNILLLSPILRDASVSYRGWPYPSVLRAEEPQLASDWIGLEVDSRIHVESWRFYQSGLFAQTMAFWEDWYGQDFMFQSAGESVPPQGKTLGVDLTIGTLTEIFQFAANLAAGPSGGETMVVRISARGLAGRRLSWPRRLDDDYERGTATISDFDFEPLIVERSKLVDDPDAFAADAARELFRRFGWDAPIGELRAMQRSLRRQT